MISKVRKFSSLPFSSATSIFLYQHPRSYATQESKKQGVGASFSKEELNEWSFEIKPHINFNEIAEKEEEYVKNVIHRKMDHLVDVRKIAAQYRQNGIKETQLNHMRHLRKLFASLAAPATDSIRQETTQQLCKAIQELFSKGYTLTNSSLKTSLESILSHSEKPTYILERDVAVSVAKLVKEEIIQLETFLVNSKEELLEIGKKVPNLSHPSVPTNDQPTILKYVNELPNKNLPIPEGAKFTEYDHVTICKRLNLLDIESASIISGPKFYYLKNEAVLLELALMQYVLQKISQKGFTMVSTPELVKRPVMEGCGFQPRGDHCQVYNIEKSDLCLIGTAEIPLAGMYANQLLNEEELPIKLVGVSHCYRTEAGSGGTREKGIYRVHQFSKVEMFVFCKPEESETIFKEIVSIQEEIFTELGFHFKVMIMPAEDLGAPASIKIDMESMMYGKQDYGEISSSSNCNEFQSRRLFIRYKNKKDRNNYFVHTLNGTGVAIPRALITIIEQNQYETVDGKVGFVIPEVLRPFMMGKSVIQEK